MRLPGVLALAALLVACSPGDRRAPTPDPGRLVAGNSADPGSLDPAHAFVKQEQTVIDDLLVGLATFDAHGRAVPGVAQSWSVSPDGLTWRFHLRPALWSDGAPVTADDFVFTFRRLVAPATGAGYAVLIYPFVNAEAINRGRMAPETLGVTAPDPHTVIIRLARPMPYLPSVLAHYGVAVVPAHAVRRWGDGWTRPGRFVSDGPYRLASWRLGDRLTLVRNPLFFDNADVAFDQVDYLPTEDSIAAERRVRRGELDLNAAFDSTRARFLRSSRSGLAAYVHAAPWTDVVYLVFRMREPPLNDVRVRQALSMAIDRDFLSRILGAGQTAALSFVPPGLGALPAVPAWAGLGLAQRQARARALLAAAGYGPGHPLRIELKTVLNNSALTSAIQADWRTIGVETRLAQTETAVFFSDLQLGDFQVAITDWIADYLDPTDYLDLMRSDQSASNYGGFVDPAYDAGLDAAEAQTQGPARAAGLQAAEQRLLDAAAVAPLFVNPSRNLVNPDLAGWYDNINDVHPARWLSRRDLTRASSPAAGAASRTRG